MRRFVSIATLTALALSRTVFAQTQPDAATLINSSIANADQNAKDALAYTFHENYVSSTETSANGTGISGGAISGGAGATRSVAGSPTSVTTANNGGGDGEFSIQYDIVFIEGFPYRRVISMDHKPLTPDSAAAESKRYDDAVAGIHEMSEQQRLKMVRKVNALMVDPKQLSTQYDCKVNGHQKIQKRPATIVECKLRADLPAPADSTELVSKDIKLWIDDQQPFFVQTRAVLNHVDKGRKLNTLTVQWGLIDGVWHQTSSTVDWVSTVGPETRGKIVDTFSDFKKFRTEATILPGFLPVVPLPPQP
jgi:hypothetical protein